MHIGGKRLKEFNHVVDNVTFHGYEIENSNLPALICLHGMTSDSKSFLGLIDLLKSDFHLILLDLPGHGETEELTEEKDYQFSSVVKRVHSVIQKRIKKPFYLLGHSWGADLALHYGAEFPDEINGIVLIDGGYAFPEQVDGMTEGKALESWKEYIDSSQYSSWNEVLKDYQQFTTRQWDDNLDAIVYSNFKKVESKYILRADRKSLLATIKAFFIEPCSKTYQHIKCPVLLFHSTIPDNDPTRDKGINRIKKELYDIKVIGIKNTKHNIHWDCPEKVAYEIKIWKKELYELTY